MQCGQPLLTDCVSPTIVVPQSPDTVGRFKSALNNVLLYLGLIGYTALGAKIFQLLELPTEKERLETNQALLLTERVIFLEIITNNTNLGEDQYQQVATYILTISPGQSDPAFSWCQTLWHPTRRFVLKSPEPELTLSARTLVTTGTTLSLHSFH